jgi:hypothetical protein
MVQYVDLTVGADPEFFLKKGRQNWSAHGIVPGTKEKPHKLKGGAVQLDGTAVEFNINPCRNALDFQARVEEVLKQVRDLVPAKFKFNYSPAVRYHPTYFDVIPEEAKQLGCNPDHDAYKGGALNNPPQPVGTMRTGAGHIHIGFCKDAKVDDPSHLADCIMLVRNMDVMVKMVEHLWDKDRLRRKMYGKLGCFRPKTYGVEYRSLSNAWLNYPELYPFIFHLTRFVYKVTLGGHDLREHFPDEKVSRRVYNLLRRHTGLYDDTGTYLNPPELPEFKEKSNGPRVRGPARRGEEVEFIHLQI